jgi:peptide chain release factor 1
MLPEEIKSYVDNLRIHGKEIEEKLADPSIYANAEECKKITREHHKLEKLFSDFDSWVRALEDLESNHEMLASETDAELRSLIENDIEELQKTAVELEDAIKISLLPPDPNDSKNIIVEVKPAAGGDEAALFAAELFRAYLYFAEKQGWKVEILERSDTDLGGLKNVSCSFSGSDVYSMMKYESGVHRVQRVPETETGGRVHTSTITVSIMPEAEEVELDIKPEDLRFDVFRSSGPGGQCVNTTDSAVRVTHIPSGLSVASQQEKSQHRNKEIALRILYARLLERKQEEENAKMAADKRSQVGTGDRSERIRTYNFPQNRVTDHRFNVSTFDLPKMMQGDIDLILNPILKIVCEQQLEALK